MRALLPLERHVTRNSAITGEAPVSLSHPARLTARLQRVRDRLGREHAALALVLAISTLLQGYRLTSIGFGNLYYAATVRSMLDNWPAFFFGSFDPAGFVTVDKPPVGLWLQAGLARVFGFHGLVLLLPQALAAVGSVALLYQLVRRTFGIGAGLLAALALALTPIAVAASRGNNLDAPLVFVLLLAACSLLRAVESGRLRPLLLCAVLIGLGFNIKMLQAYLVVPAFALLYLLAAPASLLMRLERLLQAGALLAIVSLSWALVVEVVPAERRPYIGSSQENSAIELAIGYNGLQRLQGIQRNRPTNMPNDAALVQPGTSDNRGGAATPNAGNGPFNSPAGGARPGAGPGAGPNEYLPSPGGRGATIPGGFPPGTLPPRPPNAGENGTPGWPRLLNRHLGSQIAWLLPFALVGIVVGWAGRPRLRQAREQQAIVLWGGWLLTGAAVFSFAEFFHTYYLTMIAPPIAALAGIAAAALWQHFRAGGRGALLLPVALLLTAGLQAYLLRPYPEWSARLTPLVRGGAGALALMLTVGRFIPRVRAWSLRGWLSAALAGSAGAVVLLAAPAVWSAGTVLESTNATLPRAIPPGAQATSSPGGLPPPANRPPRMAVEPALVIYLERNQGNATFLAATVNAQAAAPLIIATGKPVMALGGFSGNDPILTVEGLRARIEAGEVRYFLLGGGGGGQIAILRWIISTCTQVPASVWGSERASGATTGPGRRPLQALGFGLPLYDCGTPRTGPGGT